MCITNYRAVFLVSLLVLFFAVTACSSGRAAARESWTLIEVVSQGERIDPVIDTVIVRNCGIPETKTVECSAGTANELQVGLGGGAGLAAGFEGSIDATVSSALGIGRTSGESISLNTPEEGFIYEYEVLKQFSVVAGEIVARSSSDEIQETNYAFHASCTLRIQDRKEYSCGSGVVQPQAPIIVPPTQIPPQSPPTVSPTSEPILLPVQNISSLENIPEGSTYSITAETGTLHIVTAGPICVEGVCLPGGEDRGSVIVFLPRQNPYQLSNLVPRHIWHGAYFGQPDQWEELANIGISSMKDPAIGNCTNGCDILDLLVVGEQGVVYQDTR